MAPTKKNIVDSIFLLATRMSPTDESRYDPDYIGYKVDQVGAQLKVAQYAETGVIDYTWLCTPFILTFHKTNYPDRLSKDCDSNYSKTTIPATISLPSPDGSLDLGIYSLSSVCGKTSYYPRRASMWRYTPPENVLSKFGYYWRTNCELMVNKPNISELLFCGLLLHPEDGYLNNTNTIASGSIVSGTSYTVKYSQIIYNMTVYAPDATFTGAVGVTTYTGSGSVYLTSQVASYTDVDPYPASAEMIRQIEIEILTKEFGIEMNMLTDVRNDSKDDAIKSPAI